MRTVVELIEALQSLRSTEQRDLPMKFSLAVAMIPLSQLVALAKVAEECGFFFDHDARLTVLSRAGRYRVSVYR